MKMNKNKKIAFSGHLDYYFKTDITCNFFDISSGKTDNEAFTSLPVMEIKTNKDVTFLFLGDTTRYYMQSGKFLVKICMKIICLVSQRIVIKIREHIKIN